VRECIVSPIRTTALVVIIALVLTACATDGTDAEATATRDTVSGDAAADTIVEDTVDEGTAPEETVAEDTVAEGTATEETVTEDTVAATTAAEQGGDIPDPCGLVSGAELGSILGEDPGSGVVESLGEDQRQICSYSSGLVIFVDHADNWDGDASFGLIQNPSVAVDVGEEAYWQDIGDGSSQLVALGSGHFIGVMVPTGGQEASEQIATAVLSALADS
jgi:hypothetical protein